MSSEVSSRRLFAAAMLLALAFTSLTQSGCTRPIRRLGIIDELAISYRDAVWAKRAYNLRFANCNREYSDHFKSGFCAGYSDMCNGGDGFVPAIPPEEYRGYEYQCAEGSKCIDTWFSGYPAGVAAAREEKAGKFHEMHISRMIDQAVTQTNAPNVLPADVPVAKPSSKLLPPTVVASTKLGNLPAPLTRYAAMKSPLQSAVKTRSRSAVVEPAAKPLPTPKSTPEVHSILAKPATPAKLEATRIPPIVQSTKKADTAPPVTVSSSTSNPALPPIVKAEKPLKMEKRPPIVRGRKIDPSANVSANEIPLPMAVRSSFDTRTAAWPVNRK